MLFRSSILFGIPALVVAQTCPEVWNEVSSDLQSAFAGCNDAARAALRAPFHDCIAGACDGSLVLGGECTRSENAGLEGYCNQLSLWATQYSVGTADLIQFAQAVALAVCPGGPPIQALVGRQDSSTPEAEGQVPASSDSVDAILAKFSAIGLSANDVVALVGAHSTAIQFFDDPSQAGTALDNTPDVWDVNFYGQVLTGTAPYILESDRKLSTDLRTALQWVNFSLNQAGWAAAFSDAMNRFTVVGNDVTALTDCSSALPGALQARRVAMKAPVGKHIRDFAYKSTL